MAEGETGVTTMKKVSAVPEQVPNTSCLSWGLNWERDISAAVRTGASQGALSSSPPGGSKEVHLGPWSCHQLEEG